MTNYAWEALQGSYAAAAVMSRHGFPGVWTFRSSALKRAVDWLMDPARGNNPRAAGDDDWMILFTYEQKYSNQYDLQLGKRSKIVTWSEWLSGIDSTIN